MRPTRLVVLAGFAVLAGAVGWSGGSLVDDGSRELPRVPFAAAAVLVLLAAVLAGLAFSTRSRLAARRERQPDARPLNPLQVARFSVLARASSPVGAVVAGLYGGYAVFLAGDLSASGRSDLAGRAAAAAVAAVAVIVAALFLERVCRLPGGPPDPRAMPGPRAEASG